MKFQTENELINSFIPGDSIKNNIVVVSQNIDERINLMLNILNKTEKMTIFPMRKEYLIQLEHLFEVDPKFKDISENSFMIMENNDYYAKILVATEDIENCAKLIVFEDDEAKKDMISNEMQRISIIRDNNRNYLADLILTKIRKRKNMIIDENVYNTVKQVLYEKLMESNEKIVFFLLNTSFRHFSINENIEYCIGLKHIENKDFIYRNFGSVYFGKNTSLSDECILYQTLHESFNYKNDQYKKIVELFYLFYNDVHKIFNISNSQDKKVTSEQLKMLAPYKSKFQDYLNHIKLTSFYERESNGYIGFAYHNGHRIYGKMFFDKEDIVYSLEFSDEDIDKMNRRFKTLQNNLSSKLKKIVFTEDDTEMIPFSNIIKKYLKEE